MTTNAKDDTKLERMIFVVCFFVTLAVSLFTLWFDVSMRAFFICVIIDAFLFILWYVNYDRA